MINNKELIAHVLLYVKELGLDNIQPDILSDSGNLIIHLVPHPIVARIATYISNKNSNKAFNILNRELQVVQHLYNTGVPVLQPTSIVDAGPHNVNNVWMTLWSYIEPTKLPMLKPSEAINLVRKLLSGMKEYSGELDALGVWNRISQSANNLSNSSDSKIKTLIDTYYVVNKHIRSIDIKHLVPAHGDAHSGNLIASPKGYIWTDFEDVCLMPQYWDIASYVANLVLFKGFNHPVYRYLVDETNIVKDKVAFSFALKARVLMSVIGNLDLALKGFGDLGFAHSQLELVGGSFFPLSLP